MHTPEQIQELAHEIGNRPYHPIPHYCVPQDFSENGYALLGITIRQELMRTAMGAIIPIEYSQTIADFMCAKSANMFVNAILIQMAKDELVIKE